MSYKQKKIIAVVPAKGTSSRIASKNTKLLDGIPLFFYSIKKLLKSNIIDEVWLDTESEEIIDIVSDTNCKIFKRDVLFADNKTDGNKLFLNEVENIESDIYIQLLATSPFIKLETIENGVKFLIDNLDAYDSIVLVNKQALYTWDENGPVYDINNIPNSNDLTPTTIETMGMYISTKESALKTKRRIGEKPFQLIATAEEAIDVNYPEEFKLANFIAAGKRELDRKLYNNLKHQLTSSALSDILDDLGLTEQTTTSFTPNMKTKIFGRTKTLKLRRKKEDEDFRKIYQALHTYPTIIPGDIIVVENEVSDLAYFGEMNANLAIRSGASGALIGGKTRDSVEVKNLNFPVFSSGFSCKDVRGRAVMESFNKTISFDGILVENESLVFADSDGIVFIPIKFEKIILERMFETIQTENNIINDISRGKTEVDIVNSHGDF